MYRRTHSRRLDRHHRSCPTRTHAYPPLRIDPRSRFLNNAPARGTAEIHSRWEGPYSGCAHRRLSGTAAQTMLLINCSESEVWKAADDPGLMSGCLRWANGTGKSARWCEHETQFRTRYPPLPPPGPHRVLNTSRKHGARRHPPLRPTIGMSLNPQRTV